MAKSGNAVSMDYGAHDYSKTTSWCQTNGIAPRRINVDCQHSWQATGTDGKHNQRLVSAFIKQTTKVACDRGELKENHLRLVRVLRGPADGIVRCETRIVPVSESPDYLAVSYAWGPPVAEHAILVDGRQHLVAYNLWQFLTTWTICLEKAGHHSNYHEYEKHVWRNKSPLEPMCTCWLWVDALSIDQYRICKRECIRSV